VSVEESVINGGDERGAARGRRASQEPCCK